MSRQKENWSSVAIRLVVNTASHPIEYAKVLIQIGFEPLPPRASTTLFGKPALKLPNVFEYVKHIKSIDGFAGCYRGLAPKLCGNLASTIACHKVLDSLKLGEVTEDETNEEPELTQEQKFIRSVKRDLINRFIAIVISHPFHVMSVRMMAQFIGRETKYNGFFTSIATIYRENGICGFFKGLLPRVLGDIISLLLASSLSYAINAYFVEDKELHLYTSATMSFLASAVTYPFQVISNCMAVTNSGLAAGSPPYMPIYTSWVDCWSHLSQSNELKRGSSLLIRYYTGPQVVISGRVMPLDKQNFTIKKSVE